MMFFRILCLLGGFLLSSCNENAHLFDDISSSPSVEIADLSGIVTTGNHSITGSCFPNNSSIVVDCGAGPSAPVICVGGVYHATSVAIATLPVVCQSNLTDPSGRLADDSAPTGEAEPIWIGAQMKLVSYDTSTATYTFEDTSKTSAFNSVASSSWEIIPSSYSSVGYNGSSPLTGSGQFFSVQASTDSVLSPSSSGDTCDANRGLSPHLDPAAMGMFLIDYITIDGTIYPVNVNIGQSVSGVYTFDPTTAATIKSIFDLALGTEGITHASTVITVQNAFPNFSIEAYGIQPDGSPLDFPSMTVSYRVVASGSFDCGAATPTGVLGEEPINCIVVAGSTESLVMNNCSSGVTSSPGSNHVFNIKLSSTDNLGNTVVSHSLIYLWGSYSGALIPGFDLGVTGTVINVDDSSLDPLDPSTSFNDFSLDIDADTIYDYSQGTLPGFVHDYVIPGAYNGVYTVDHIPYWSVGPGEVFSEYFIDIP